MKKFFKSTLFFAGQFLCSVMAITDAQAQKEYSNWYFGNQAGISFAAGNPQATTGSAMTTYEGCSSISNPQGQLLMYSNGENVWDVNHQIMPNGSSLGSHNSASQGVIILRAPGSNTIYYIFTVDAIDNNLAGGLRYSVVDMSLRGGLGDVTATKAVRLPTPTTTGKVTEKLTAALHANGRDYWVIVHGWESNNFFSFLLTSTGVNSAPVVSAVGPVHQGGGSFFGSANAVGYMKISPNGTKLALAQRDSQFELYDYNNNSGQVSNYISLRGTSSFHYGVEFSPDNSRLYTTMYSDGGFDTNVYQYNIQAGSSTAIQNSRQIVASIPGLSSAIQAASDGKLYLSGLNKPYLNSIEYPNNLGSACGFQQNSVSLGIKLGQNGLPNQPNVVSVIMKNMMPSTMNRLKIYPNPTKDFIVLYLSDNMIKDMDKISVLDLMGRTVVEYKVADLKIIKGELVIPVNAIARGEYIIKATSSNESNSKRVILE
ncbi:T9SS type A sorting domain-containing protein [Hymenobacter swuensis]|uniref:Secretion system C-terminal sorting domain-containing protein n=1 Tax=Hymenobacter swuensis DY53 TaxID=1227739 RepID=W8EVK6_9BACT|nr:T9SS type A sorting domain-containing protein [Hymenobacter swuensis]AHJ97254.1 hypothetical protein Hsw_1659 [Hymenobacter swuensis DY53]